MSSPPPQGAPHSAGLRRDMEVLRELASDECLRRNGLGVVRIAVRLGREKSQVSRALRALEAEGLVRRNGRNRTYQLGWGLYTLAARGVESRLVLAASAHLYQLADDQRADVRLCVLIGGRVLTLISMPTAAADAQEELCQTPCGPVLALDWPDAALEAMVSDGIADHGNLLAGCAQARARGYLQSPATRTEPTRYAAPVRDSRGTVLAAIQLAPRPGEESSVGIPPEKAILAAADALSEHLGFDLGLG